MRWPTLSILLPSCDYGVDRDVDRDVDRHLMLSSINRQRYDGAVEIVERDTLAEALAVARGDIVAIQTGGNYYLADAFARAVAALVRSPRSSVVAGSDVRVDANHPVIYRKPLLDEPITPRSLLMKRSIPTHCAFSWRSTLASIDARVDDSLCDGGVGFWYRLLHFTDGAFIPHYLSVFRSDRSPAVLRDARWRARMKNVVANCEADARYAERFHFSAAEKAHLDRRWALLEARQVGNAARVSTLLDELYRGSDHDTRTFLVRHGFLPLPPVDASRIEQPMPDLNWCADSPNVKSNETIAAGEIRRRVA